MPPDAAPRCAFRGSLDPTTGIFYRLPEGARIRTAQACDKCRIRKAKCSGDHPVCERCRIRGLVCHYAPERRGRRRSRGEAVRDRSSGPAPVPSSDARTTQGPLSRIADERSQHTENAVGQRCPTIASAEARSTSTEAGLDVHSASGPRTGHAMSQEVLETIESSITCEGVDGGGTSDDDLGMPGIEDNASTLCFESYPGDPHGFLEDILTPMSIEGPDAACFAPAERDLVHVDPDPRGTGHRDAVDGARYPLSFQHSPCFDLSSVDPGILSDHERRPFCDAKSPDWTPLTSPSASPVLTRESSAGLPATPTNSYHSAPFTLTSLSPHLGPFASPHPYLLFMSEVQTTEMGTDGICPEYVAWDEGKDSPHAFGEDLSVFLDLDALF
ncbi:hypothetical protein OG21DRAFT_1482465 [Imleria badia]|nr:hypothetical protein OG21DRAFT_1482465 [Imleria badia]